MAQTSPRRGLLRSALALSCLALSAACGDPKPQKPPPPLVSLNVPEPNTIGTSLKVSVTVTGCDSLQSLTLLNEGVAIKPIPYAGGEALVDVAKNEVPYASGIPASLALSARAVCADGRESTSPQASATFFPVEKVVEPTDGTQVVTDFFIAEGSGDATVSFIGCGNASTGIGSLYRVDARGYVTARMEMPFTCTAQTAITERHSTGTRWVWTPDSGVMAIKLSAGNDAFTVTAQANPQLRLTWLTMDPDGNAIAGTHDGRIVRLDRAGGLSPDLVLWAYTPGGTVIGEPIFRPELGEMLLPIHELDPANQAEGAVSLHKLSYKNGPTVDGKPISSPILKYLYGVDPTPPAAAFNADGQSLYLSFLSANSQSRVIACKTNGTLDAAGNMPCESGNQLWQSTDLQGDVLALIPYANGTRLAAIAAQHVWFLNPHNQGAVVNKGGKALSPNGALVARQIQRGVPGGINGGNEFYLLNGSPSSLLTTELIGVDSAEQGEVFRYLQGGGDFSMAVDASGAAWMRVNKKLVKLMRLGEYRAARPAN